MARGDTAQRLMPIGERDEGHLIDELQLLADKQDELNTELKAVKALEEIIETEIIRRLAERKTEGSRGKLCSVVIERANVPKMGDYDVFIAAVRRRGDYHMLERRISVTAWREWADHNKGKPYPGTTSFTRVSLHRSKLTKK